MLEYYVIPTYASIFCVTSPGKTGDTVVFKCMNLNELIDLFPEGCYVPGDEVYPLSDKIMVPFTAL